MKLRSYRESDLERLKQIHAKQGFPYDFPDLTDATFAVGCMAEDDSGQLNAGLFLRITAEAYLLLDPESGTPAERKETFLAVHENVRQNALGIGLQDVHAFLPPTLSKAFDRRLKKLGWSQETWRALSYRLR